MEGFGDKIEGLGMPNDVESLIFIGWSGFRSGNEGKPELWSGMATRTLRNDNR